MINWPGSRVKNLRLRLGWSRADLALRLKCEAQIVSSWENEGLLGSNLLADPKSVSDLLHSLERQAEQSSDELQMACHVDNVLENGHLDQCQKKEVDETI